MAYSEKLNRKIINRLCRSSRDNIIRTLSPIKSIKYLTENPGSFEMTGTIESGLSIGEYQFGNTYRYIHLKNIHKEIISWPKWPDSIEVVSLFPIGNRSTFRSSYVRLNDLLKFGMLITKEKYPEGEHPFKINPKTRGKLEKAIRKFAKGKTWKEYHDRVFVADMWDDIVESISKDINNQFRSHWDKVGMYPDTKTCDVFDKIEKEIFGRCVTGSL